MPSRPIQDYFFRDRIGTGQVPEKNIENVPALGKKRKRANEEYGPRKRFSKDNVYSTAGPVKEDESEIILDLDGWQHIIRDEEDLEFLRQFLKDVPDAPISGSLQVWAWEEKVIKEHYHVKKLLSKQAIEGYHVANKSGCARTEGYSQIPLSEKFKYLPHYAEARQREKVRAEHALGNNDNSSSAWKLDRLVKQTVPEPGSSLITARANRRNQRAFAKNMTEQLRILSSGDSDAVTFNQLRKRKKRLRFSRSPVHGWGVFTEENISAKDMIVEYVGEIIRKVVANRRERKYLESGIVSCYLFELDDYHVIDATKTGGVARLINHTCMHNTESKTIKVDGRKRLVLYASRNIAKDEEITFNYKFPLAVEGEERIKCLCGTKNCVGFLN